MPQLKSFDGSWTDYTDSQQNSSEQNTSREYHEMDIEMDNRDNPELPKAPLLTPKNQLARLKRLRGSTEGFFSGVPNHGSFSSYPSYTDGKKSSSISAPPNSPHEYSGRI